MSRAASALFQVDAMKLSPKYRMTLAQFIGYTQNCLIETEPGIHTNHKQVDCVGQVSPNLFHSLAYCPIKPELWHKVSNCTKDEHTEDNVALHQTSKPRKQDREEDLACE